MTQADSPTPAKRLDASYWEQCSQTYSEEIPTTRDISTSTNLEMSESSTQTYSQDDKKKLDMANEAFGAFVGQELKNVPIIKRRYIMYQIIKIIENNS